MFDKIISYIKNIMVSFRLWLERNDNKNKQAELSCFLTNTAVPFEICKDKFKDLKEEDYKKTCKKLGLTSK